MNKNYYKSEGFSLVEMMIAIFVLAVVMGIIIVAFSQLQAMGRKTEMVMTAANLAQKRMEIAMREPFETLDTLNESPQYIDQYGNISGSNENFKRETIITTPPPDSSDSSLTHVLVRVYYKTYGYQVGGGTSFGLNILNGKLIEKDWSPVPVELSTIIVDN